MEKGLEKSLEKRLEGKKEPEWYKNIDWDYLKILEDILKVENKNNITKVEIAKGKREENIFPYLSHGIFLRLYSEKNEKIELSYENFYFCKNRFLKRFLKILGICDYEKIEKTIGKIKRYFENRGIEVKIYDSFD